jgi:hypothetical protein
MIDGKSGIGSYVYASYIRSITEGRQIFYQCDRGYTLQGTLCHHVCFADFCAHPKKSIGNFANGIIRIMSLLGAYEYKDYIDVMAHSREIIYDCESGYYLQGQNLFRCVE